MFIKNLKSSFFTSGVLNIDKMLWDEYKIHELVKANSIKDISSLIKVFVNNKEYTGNITRDDTKYKDGKPTTKIRFWINKCIALNNFSIDDLVYFDINNIDNDMNKSSVTLKKVESIDGMSSKLISYLEPRKNKSSQITLSLLHSNKAKIYFSNLPYFERKEIQEISEVFLKILRQNFAIKIKYGDFFVILEIHDKMCQMVLKERLLAPGKILTLEEIAKIFGKTRERVRQIESKLIDYINIFDVDIDKFQNNQKIKLQQADKENLMEEILANPDPLNLNKELSSFRNKILDKYLLGLADDDEVQFANFYILSNGGYKKVFLFGNGIRISSMAYINLVKWYMNKYGELPKCKNINERKTSVREYLATKLAVIKKNILEGKITSFEEQKELQKLGVSLSRRKDDERIKFEEDLEKLKLYLNKNKKIPPSGSYERTWLEMKGQSHVPPWQTEIIKQAIDKINHLYNIDIFKINTALDVLRDFAHADYINCNNPNKCLISKYKLKKYEKNYIHKITFKLLTSKISFNKKWYDVAIEHGYEKVEIRNPSSYEIFNAKRAKERDIEDV